MGEKSEMDKSKEKIVPIKQREASRDTQKKSVKKEEPFKGRSKQDRHEQQSKQQLPVASLSLVKAKFDRFIHITGHWNANKKEHKA